MVDSTNQPIPDARILTGSTHASRPRNRSAVLHGVKDLRIEDREIPTPGPGEVLVRVEATGICGSDIHYFEHGRVGQFVVTAPMVVGHESAGVIVEVGEGVVASRKGQRVALEPGVPCRHCEQCRSGRYNLCPDMRFFATPPIDGSITGYVAIDADFAHPAPEGLSSEQAAMAEPVAVGVWACRRASVVSGDRVMVTGAGPIGLFTAQVAHAFGAARVTVTDISDPRLDAARALGLEVERSDEPGEAEFDVLLECSGAPAALELGLRRMAPAGRVVLVGMGADEVSIAVPQVQGRELTLTGIFRYANTYPAALALIASGAVQVDPVITHRFAVEETEAAMSIARKDPTALKSMVLGDPAEDVETVE